jgi:hypothetical protein
VCAEGGGTNLFFASAWLELRALPRGRNHSHVFLGLLKPLMNVISVMIVGPAMIAVKAMSARAVRTHISGLPSTASLAEKSRFGQFA